MNKESLLHAYMNGEATAEEIRVLEADEHYRELMKISKATSDFQTPSFNETDGYDQIKLHKQKSKVRRIKPLAFFLRIAAAFVLLSAGYYFLRDTETIITTEIAEKIEFALPDASNVRMNAMSKISFDEDAWDEKRVVSLDGEAYFKVKKGEKFLVKTPMGAVEVLGTQFNVFSRNNRFHIQCYEGLVSVTFKDSTMQLPAGSGILINNLNGIENNYTTRNAPNWIENESSFQNVSLSLVLEELKRQYPIQITTQIIVDKKFTGSFTHTNLSVALRSICDPLQVDFTIEGEEVTLHAKPNN